MELLAAYVFTKRFLAEATDGHLSDAEASVILADGTAHAEGIGSTPEALRTAIEDSEGTYDRLLVRQGPIAVVRHFRRCVAALGEGLDGAARQRLHEEMQGLVQADGRVTDMEQHFVDEIARTWLVCVAREGVDRLGPDARDQNEAPDLRPYVVAQMYLAKADGGLVHEEARSILKALGNIGRRHRIDDQRLAEMVDAAQAEYHDAHDRGDDALHRLFLASLAQVRSQWADEPETLHAMADSMLHLASSDGAIDDLEATLLQDIATAWQRAGTDQA